MSVPLTLLGLLEREPSHGYDLKRNYDTYFGREKQLPFGQVYATLGRLARDGKVIGGEAEPGEGPDRKRYAITDLGRAEVDSWLADPVEPEPHLQTILFAKVTLALMLGKPARLTWTSSVPRTSGGCRSSPSSGATVRWWTCCSPIMPCSTWRRTFDGSISRQRVWQN